MKSGKREMGNFRWTVVFEKQNGKWRLCTNIFPSRCSRSNGFEAVRDLYGTGVFRGSTKS